MASAEEAYQKGFWQRTLPVPLDRRPAVSNTTCLHNILSVRVEDWQKRALCVLLIGAQKGGTTAMAYYLYNHPRILYLPTKKLHYFDEELDQNASIILQTTGGGIPSQTALQHYQESVIGTLVPLATLQHGSTKLVLDATPNYLFVSDRVPHRVL
jgi:hypothetical protein